MNIRQTIITTTVALTMVAMIAPVSAGAMTAAELQAQINALMAQLQAMQGPAAGTPAVCAGVTFSRNLMVGSSGSDVTCLQALLHVTPMSGWFGPITLAAVQNYQSQQGWVPASQVGPLTRAKLNAWLSGSVVVTPTPSGLPAGCTSTVGYSPTTGMPCSGTSTPSPVGLSGSVGSITVTGLSTYSSEEVGEAEDDVKVLAFEVEADAGSDVKLTSLKVELNQQTAADSENLDDYATDVSVWMGSTEIGRADVDSFSDSATSDVWVKTITLNNAVVKAGATAKFYLAVSGASTLDSGDIDTDDWQIGVSSVRFVDASGVSTTEAVTLDIDDDTVDDEVEQAFDFTSFATAADVKFKITEKTDPTINESHTINVDDTEDTNDVPVLSFNVKIEGDSDVKLDALPVEFTMTATTITNLDDSDIKGFHLLMNGTEVGTADLTDCATDADCDAVGLTEDYVFDDLGLNLEAGKNYDFKVLVDFSGLDEDLDAGDTILATLDEDQTDQGEFDAEDATGEALADGDITGTAASDASDIRDIGFTFNLKSRTATITSSADPATATSADTGTYTIKFELTAFDGDVTIDRSCEAADANDDGDTADANEGNGEADEGVVYTDSNSANTTESCSLTSTADDNADDTGAAWLLKDGETKEFTLTVALTADTDGFAKVYLTSINWDDTVTDTSPDLYYTSGLGETKTSTPELYLQII
jgi:hypothetical protein